jgi:hypothetical protein
MALPVIQLAGSRRGIIILDFCSGGGHLGLLLAHLLPQVSHTFFAVLLPELSHIFCICAGHFGSG